MKLVNSNSNPNDLKSLWLLLGKPPAIEIIQNEFNKLVINSLDHFDPCTLLATILKYSDDRVTFMGWITTDDGQRVCEVYVR